MNKNVRNYLAYTLASGWCPDHMRLSSDWSTEVLLGRDYIIGTGRWGVKEKLVPALQDHPFVVNVNRFKALGFELAKHMGRKGHMTLRRGIPMMNHDTKQEIWIQYNGTVRQTVGPGGKWKWIKDILTEEAIDENIPHANA